MLDHQRCLLAESLIRVGIAGIHQLISRGVISGAYCSAGVSSTSNNMETAAVAVEWGTVILRKKH